MWNYYPELLATPVPRYTSFPTAAEFGTAIGANDYRRALSGAAGDISLYIHIPFCQKICWYCGCNTAAANRPQRLASYLDALHREIALVADLLPAGAKVRRVAFGGGSPNAISPVDFVRLFDQLTLKFALADPLVSIELDPRTLGPDWEGVIRVVGAERASLGVQTFAPHLQEAIGRVQPLAMIEGAVEMLRRAGVTSLNMDLMYGLPGQTLDDLVSAIDQAQGLGADRLAVFGYAHVPQLIPRQRRIDAGQLPGQQLRFAMAAMAYRHLIDAGYVPAGFDHFARKGDPLAQAALAGRLHRNFQGFTDDGAQVLIGLGASAISSFPGLLAQNEKNSGRYQMQLSQGRLPVALGKARSADDRRRGAIIAQLLCQGRAAIDPVIMADAADRLAPFAKAGLCEYSGAMLAIPAAALPYARSIAACFDPNRQHSPRRFSSAV